MDDEPVCAVPTSDVLPTGVRRRRGLRDLLLPAVLSGELLAGVLLGMAWEVASTVPPVTVPVSSTIASTGDAVVVVPPVAAPPTPPPPPRRTVPRNPFEVQPG